MAVLLIFGAFLASLGLRLLANAICRITNWQRIYGVLCAILFICIIALACFWFMGASIVSQFHDLLIRARTGWAQLKDLLNREGIDPKFLSGNVASISIVPDFLGRLIELAEAAVILAITAIYLAIDPDFYRSGFSRLVPRRLRVTALRVLDTVSDTLELWIRAQCTLMLIVGTASYLALALLGVRNAAVLGFIAGLTEGVPYLGPFIGAIPALLSALAQGIMTAVWTALIYVVLHIIEGYLLSPVLQRWFVRIPPALVLSSIFICQLMFGFAGLVLAAPLAAALFSLVNAIRDENERTSAKEEVVTH